jgi:Kdo2-lipid IVA lauroyltransferase/acyltransferase
MRRSRRKPKWWKTAINWAGYLFMEAFSRAFVLLPFHVASALGEIVGTLGWLLGAKERRKALRNLELAFGDAMGPADRERIVKAMFRNFGRDAAEAFAATRLSGPAVEALADNAREFIDHMQSLRSEGKGLIAMTGHLGNWELVGALGARALPVSVVANRFSFEPFNRVVERLRTAGGMKTIYLNESPREIVRALQRNDVVGILPDQDIRKIPGTFVTFFGRPAWTPIGPVLMAKLSGAPMVPYFLVRKGRTYHVEIGDRIRLEFTGDRVRDLRENTQRWSDAYEALIRKYPDQWGWNHLRWNTKPEEVPEAFRRNAGLEGEGEGEGKNVGRSDVDR